MIKHAEDTLKSLQQQARVPADQMVGMFVVLPPTAPTATMPSRMKSTITIFVAGAGLALLVTVLADVLLTHFKSRAQRRQKFTSRSIPLPWPRTSWKAHDDSAAGRDIGPDR